MDPSNVSSCSTCFKRHQELQERVQALELKVSYYGQLLNQLEEIKEEMLAEIRGENNGEEDVGVDIEGNKDTLAQDLAVVGQLDEQVPVDLSIGVITPGIIGNSTSFSTSGDKNSDDADSNNLDSEETQSETDLNEAIDLSKKVLNVTNQNDQPFEPQRKRYKIDSKYGGARLQTATFPEELLICPHCTSGHIFKQEGGLLRHLKTYHSENPETFKCLECKKSYFRKDDLIYHIKSVHEKVRFHCDVEGCQKTYTTKGHLRKHQQLCHGIGSSNLFTN